jgi:hypothetical protein
LGITFSLYAEQEGGSPLWLETQNVQTDKNGNYSVMLGFTTSQGLPSSLFVSGQARWLGVRVQGQEEQPRVLLLSVPYALKAGDAQTLGGQPASAFLTASSSNAANGNGVINNAISGSGTTDYVPLWLSKSKLGSSKIFQSASGDLGVGTTSPAANLDVNGTSDIRNTLTLFPNGSAPTLSVNGTAFQVSNTGTVTFVSGQTFPGTATLGANAFTGNQTVNGNVSATGVVTGSSYQIGSNLFAFGSFDNVNAFLGFAGSPAANQSATEDTAVGSQALWSDTGGFNTAVGAQALMWNTTGTLNTASGAYALVYNVTGTLNTASGAYALQNNYSGEWNTATGEYALYLNTSGSYNTAAGAGALSYVTGSFNTGIGENAGSTPFDSGVISGPNNTFIGANTALPSGSINGTPVSNATAIGANAEVAASNAMVLGSINGVNGATASVNVGIGTTAPASALDVESNAAAGIAPILWLKNQAAIQSGSTGNAVDLHFTPDSGGAVGTPNAYIRAQEDGNGSYGTSMQFGTVTYGSGDSSERMRITSTGNVGIGTTTPSNIFTIGQGLGAAVADGWSTYSSRRWKTNIHTLPDALSKVEQLRGVSYDLKSSGKHEIGVIAEEVGAVVPEVVSWDKNGKDAQGVDYSRLTALLIEATKEQQALINKQQQQIRKQQAQLAQLMSQVKAIQASLKTSVRTGTEVRTVKAQVPPVQQ